MTVRAALSLPLLATALLGACAWNPRPLPPTEPPAALEQSIAEAQVPLAPAPETTWWRAFGSARLTALVTELEQQSFDLAAARARIARARALAGEVRRANWPSVSARAQARGQRDFDTGTSTHSDSGGFSAAYDVDLWGVRGAANRIAGLDLALAEYDARALGLALKAETAAQYLAWLATRARFAIAEQNLAAAADLLRLIQLRFDAGSASGIELDQQRNTFLTARAQQLGLKREAQARTRALAALLGRESLLLEPGEETFVDLDVPSVALVQPARLLEYRPDVKLAELELARADAGLFQSQQRRWPGLTLAADLTVAGLDDLNEGWTGSVLASLAAPLFNADGIAQQIEAARADLSIAEFGYRQTVLQAFLETLEALSEQRYQVELWAVRRDELANNEHLYELARVRYEAGDTDFLNLLTAQRSFFNARDGLIQAELDVMLAAIDLYRALGTPPERADDKVNISQVLR